jgi:hypothetical protein
MRSPLLLLLLLPLLFSPEAVVAESDADKEFRRRVDKAITKGCAYLAAMQTADGTWKSPYDAKWPGGATALCLLALLSSEHNVWSDTVTKSMKYVLSKLDYPEKNYDVIGIPDPRIVGPKEHIYMGDDW